MTGDYSDPPVVIGDSPFPGHHATHPTATPFHHAVFITTSHWHSPCCNNKYMATHSTNLQCICLYISLLSSPSLIFNLLLQILTPQRRTFTSSPFNPPEVYTTLLAWLDSLRFWRCSQPPEHGRMPLPRHATDNADDHAMHVLPLRPGVGGVRTVLRRGGGPEQDRLHPG